ncbi:MAG: HAMP domain-containing protein, partial [Candidatus Methylumidiphilus sp.]
MSWNNIRVRQKFLLSLSPLILILALQSGMSMQAIGNLGWIIGYVGEGWEHRTQVTEVEVTITGVQSAVGAVLLSNRAEDWAKVNVAIAAVSDRISEAHRNLERFAGMAVQLNATARAFEEYRAAVNHIRELSDARNETYQTAVREPMRAEEKALSEIMRTAYHGGDAVSSFYAGSALAELTEITGAVQQLMAGGVDAFNAAVATHFDDLSENLNLLTGMATTRFARNQIGAVVTQTAALRKSLNTLVETTLHRASDMNQQVLPAARALGEALQQISRSASQRTEEISRTASSEASAAMVRSGGVAAGGMLIAVIIALFAGRSLARPLIRLTRAMTALAGGDTAIAVPDTRRKDEIGDIGNAFDGLINYMQEVGAAASTIAENDLTVTVTPKSEK